VLDANDVRGSHRTLRAQLTGTVFRLLSHLVSEENAWSRRDAKFQQAMSCKRVANGLRVESSMAHLSLASPLSERYVGAGIHNDNRPGVHVSSRRALQGTFVFGWPSRVSTRAPYVGVAHPR
jgi:hypothetical protein